MSNNPKGDLDPRPGHQLYGEPSGGLTKKPPKVSKARRGLHNLMRDVENKRVLRTLGRVVGLATTPPKKDPCAAANRRARAAESMLKAMKK